MAALVKKVVGLNHSQQISPALFILSEQDEVVDAKKSLQIAKQWGGKSSTHLVNCGPNDDPNSHTIVGDIKSPNQTKQLVETSLAWIKSL
jgi:hypothetical protein